MLKTLLLAAAAVLATGLVAILVLAAMRPDSFQVQRSISISAQPERIYPLIADFREWARWSPWEKKDPAMTRSFAGAASGVGARYGWDGKAVGQGSMAITEASAPSRVGLDLDFVKPFEAHNKAVFTLTPEGPATRVTWTMTGPAPFLFKVVHVVMNMDRMVGGDFQAGLQALKSEAER